MSKARLTPCVVENLNPRRHFDAGFTGTYFANTNFTGATVQRADASVAFSWGKSAPAPRIAADHFSARWTTTITPTATGRHAIYVSTEGGVRVWLGGKLMLNRWAAPGVRTDYKFVATLTTGEPADLLIEYRHDAGKGTVGVTWVQPGQHKAILTGATTAARTPDLDDQIDHAKSYAADQLGATYRSLKVADGAPVRSEPAKPAWYRAPFTDWTAGTFAGAMWQLNDAFVGAGWDKLATTWTTPLANVKQAGDAFDREWAAYKPLYDATGDASARQVLLKSAALKMSVWNKTVRAFQTPEIVTTSGNAKANFGVLMDQTNDMAELLWAGQQSGDASYRDRVLANMNTVAKFMVRANGSVVQRGYFDAKTGAYVLGENAQGYSDTSTWSRAQAWAMNSFSEVAADTGDATMLATAKKVANYFIANTPADGVPYWDFAAPTIPHTYRDSSAAAIAADALVRLSTLTSGNERATYKAAAEKILKSLLSPAYLTEGTALKGVLQHGAQHVPAGKGVDASLMFGDYYLLAAVNDYTSLTA